MLSLEKYLIAKTAKEGNEQDQVKLDTPVRLATLS